MSFKPLLFDMLDSLCNDNIKIYESKNKDFTEKFSTNKLLNQIDPILQLEPKIICNVDGINGLYYIPKYLTNNELTMLKDKIESDEIKLEPISSSKNSRCVAHFGYFYSYDHTGLKPADPIPNYLKNLALANRINQFSGHPVVNNEFDQVIINEYEPGQQISYHTDHTKLFGPIIACITVGEAVPIKFKLDDIEKKINVEEGSMYIMTGDARYKWQHSLRNNTKNNRYSITYRTIR